MVDHLREYPIYYILSQRHLNSEVYLDPEYLSIDDIKENVENLEYSEDRIKELYFSRPNDEGGLNIIRTLIMLIVQLMIVR